MATGRPPVEIKADTRQFIELFGKSSQVDKKLRTALRKRMKAAAEKAAADSRTEVEKPPVEAGKSHRHRGLRRGIAAGIKVGLTSTTGAKRVGVTIKASKSSLPPDMQSLVKAYSRGRWRHPVFANRNRRAGLRSVAGNKSLSRSTRKGAGDLRRALDARSRGRETWVEQSGRPFFEPVIDRHQGNVEAAVLAAMEEAVASLGKGTPRG